MRDKATLSKFIAEYIARDIKCRNGLGDEWEQIRPDIQKEIIAEWADRIEALLNQ